MSCMNKDSRLHLNKSKRFSIGAFLLVLLAVALVLLIGFTSDTKPSIIIKRIQKPTTAKTSIQLDAHEKPSYSVVLKQIHETTKNLASTPIHATKTKAQLLIKLGELQDQAGDKGRSLASYSDALPLARQLADWLLEGKILTGIGSLHQSLGNPQLATRYYRDASLVYGAHHNYAGQAKALSSLGQNLLELGSYQESLKNLQKAQRISETIHDLHTENSVLEGLAKVYAVLGESGKAHELYQSALAVWLRLGDFAGEARASTGLARIYIDNGNLETAEALLERALARWRQLGDKNGETSALLALGDLRMSKSQFDEAFSFFARAEAISVDDPRSHAQALSGMAAVQTIRYDIVDALRTYEEAISLQRLSKDLPGEAQTRLGLARVEHSRGNLIAAQGHAEKALAIVESLRPVKLSPELKSTFLATQHGVYDFYVHLLGELGERSPSRGYDVLAFQASERAHARALLDLLSDQQETKPINHGYTAQSIPLTPLTLSEIQRSLIDTDTVLLEYFLGEQGSFLWAVSADSFTMFELPPRIQVEALARQAYQLLSTSNHPEAAGNAELSLQRLGNLLLGPVMSRLSGRRLAIVADGALLSIPFSALSIPDRPNVPLIVDHEIVQLPSASVLATIRQNAKNRSTPPRMLAVFADPVFQQDDPRLPARFTALPEKEEAFNSGSEHFARLPFSLIEARSILKMAPQNANFSAFGFAATRDLAMSPSLAKYRFLHFATHAVVNTNHPKLSGIMLSSVDKSGHHLNGFLGFREISQSRFPADLVVLSACSTALGKNVRGEGLVGLSYAFFSAGAQRVVSSLWDTDDRATAELMERFYRGMLIEKLSPTAALRMAQVSMWREARWHSPYYWAPFVQSGDWTPYQLSRPEQVREPITNQEVPEKVSPVD